MGASDSDGATLEALWRTLGHSGVWGKCLVDTIGDVVQTWDALLLFSCTRRDLAIYNRTDHPREYYGGGIGM